MEMQLIMGPLSFPQMIKVNMEQWWNDNNRKKTTLTKKNPENDHLLTSCTI
jgi:hypothetical protein